MSYKETNQNSAREQAHREFSTLRPNIIDGYFDLAATGLLEIASNRPEMIANAIAESDIFRAKEYLNEMKLALMVLTSKSSTKILYAVQIFSLKKQMTAANEKINQASR